MKRLLKGFGSTLGVAVVALGVLTTQVLAEKIKIATEGAYFPWNYVDDSGKLVGFDVDIANALCKEMKADCEIIAQDWAGIIPGLLAKKYDVIVASMAMTEKRKKKVAFTRKYKDSISRFVAKKGAITDTTPDGMSGKRIGVQKGTSQHNWLEANGYGKTAEIVLYDTTQGPELDLVSGRIDAMIGNEVTYFVKFFNKEGSDKFDYVGPQIKGGILGEGSGIALRKGEDALREKLNGAIEAILASGEYDDITKKYFPFPVMGK